MYGQISKWFQNHSYLDRRDSGCVQKKRIPVADTSEQDDDEAAIQEHLRELGKECSRKKITDQDKIVRLLSLTHAARREIMLKITAATRVSDTIEKYGILEVPSYVSNHCNALVQGVATMILLFVVATCTCVSW